jgi:hypothetical protein
LQQHHHRSVAAVHHSLPRYLSPHSVAAVPSLFRRSILLLCRASYATSNILSLCRASYATSNILSLCRASYATSHILSLCRASYATSHILSLCRASYATSNILSLCRASYATSNILSLCRASYATPHFQYPGNSSRAAGAGVCALRSYAIARVPGRRWRDSARLLL